MKKVAQTFMLALGLLMFANSQALAATKITAQKQHTDIYAQYFFTAETSYRKIEINGLKLKVTYFKDAGNRCKNWIEQRPCWTQKDLQSREARLSKKELTEFVTLINGSEFLTLDKVHGGAKEGQRYYTETIKVKLGEVQHEVVYQSFPGAVSRPAAFEKVSKWLSGLAKKRLKV